ncbi:YfbM family protein [Sphingomonas hankookensis]
MVIYLRRAGDADIDRLVADPSVFEDFLFEEGVENLDFLDLGETWHVLHYLLTGSADDAGHVLGIVIAALPELGADEHGEGGIGLIAPPLMRAFADALDRVDDATLARRFDPRAMARADVYMADSLGGADALDYVMQGVPALRNFAANCRRTGDGAIRVIAHND